MQAIGLAMKDIIENPFTGKRSGELMLIHRCLGCGAISVNRIAGDDDPYAILALIDEPLMLSCTCRRQLMQRGITLVTRRDREDIHRVLFGLVR